MLSALLVALREGVEAALVVGIVLVYLNRTGRRALTKYVWAGVALAAAASVVAAILLDRWKVSEDGFEGLLMLVASALVVTMIVWMNRVARTLRKDIESRLETYAQQSTRAAGWGIGAFVFLMVVREGAELVLILRAVELSSAGVEVWIGTLVRNRACGRGGTLLLPRNAENSAAPLLCCDERDFNGCRVPVGSYRAARIERGNVAAIEQDWRWRRLGRSCAMKFSSSS